LNRVVWALFTGAWAVIGGIGTGHLARVYLKYLSVEPAPWGTGAVTMVQIGFILLGVLLGWLLGALVYRRLLELAEEVVKLSFYDQVVSGLGAVIGLVVASLVSLPLIRAPAELSVPVFVVVAVICVLVSVLWLRRLAWFPPCTNETTRSRTIARSCWIPA